MSGVLPRPRLERRVDDVLGRRLTLVVAGAGYGKSTLVATWSRAAPTAWVRLDERARDPRGRVVQVGS